MLTFNFIIYYIYFNLNNLFIVLYIAQNKCPETTITTETATATATTISASVIDIGEKGTFTCSSNKLRPDDEWIQRKFCDDFFICNANKLPVVSI